MCGITCWLLEHGVLPCQRAWLRNLLLWGLCEKMGVCAVWTTTAHAVIEKKLSPVTRTRIDFSKRADQPFHIPPKPIWIARPLTESSTACMEI